MAKATKAAVQNDEMEDVEDAPPKKSRKKLILFVVAVIVLVGGGAAAFLLLNPPPAPRHGGAKAEKAARSEVPPIFVDLGQFTANLMRENEDRYLQVAISLKITESDLEEKSRKTNRRFCIV